MRLDAEDVADILAAIRDEGALVTWQSQEDGPLVDPDKPWLGHEETPKDSPVWICFVDVATAGALLTQWGKDTDVASSSSFGLMGNVGFSPTIGDLVTRPGRENIVVKDITTAEPADVPLFYLLEFTA